MLSYAEIDPVLFAWAKKHRLGVFTSFKDEEVRSVEVVSEVGDRYQIWVDIPSNGTVSIHTWDLKRRRRDWTVAIANLEKSLDDSRGVMNGVVGRSMRSGAVGDIACPTPYDYFQPFAPPRPRRIGGHRAASGTGGNRDIWVTGNTVTATGGAQAIRFGDTNQGIWVTNNTVTSVGADTAQGLRFGKDNTNLNLSDNTFNAVSGDVFVFSGLGNELAAGSIGNVVKEFPGVAICGGALGGFTGVLEVTDPDGDLLIFEDGCVLPP